MKGILGTLSTFLLLLTACSAPAEPIEPPQPTPTVQITVSATVTAQPTAVPSPTSQPTMINTPVPTATAVPTTTPTDIPSPATELHNNKPILYYDAADGHYYRISLHGGEPDQLTQQPDSGHVMPSMVEQTLTEFNTPSVSPDGRFLLQYDVYHSWQLLSVPDRQLIAEGSSDLLYSPSWSPDSQQFAYRKDEHALCVFNLATRSEQCLWRSDSRLFSVDWSPDGRFIAVAEDEEGNDFTGLGQLWLINSDSGVARPVHAYSGATEVELGSIFTWLPNDEALLIYVIPEGGSVRYLPESDQTFHFPGRVRTASPDGRFFYTFAGELFDATGTLLYQIADPDACRHFRFGHHAWSPDGNRLAFVSACNEIDNFEGEWTLTIVDVVSKERVWEKVLSANYSLLGWATDEDTLLLNHRTSGWPRDTDIYTIDLSSSDEPQLLISGAIFLGYYPQWLTEK